MSELRQFCVSGQTEATAAGAVAPYSQRLTSNWRWAMAEASAFFEGSGGVYDTLRRICTRLNDLKIPYAVVGGLAVFRHGVRRFTEDVDILVTKDGLQQIHAKLEGLGYVAPFAGSKNLRDADSGVKIEFLVTGNYPGDGKAKPVAFPDPAKTASEYNGVRFLNLEALVELKLASGMTGAGRQKDLADVIALIKTLRLAKDFATRLDAYVRDTYAELWGEAQAAQTYEQREEREGWSEG